MCVPYLFVHMRYLIVCVSMNSGAILIRECESDFSNCHEVFAYVDRYHVTMKMNHMTRRLANESIMISVNIATQFSMEIIGNVNVNIFSRKNRMFLNLRCKWHIGSQMHI